MQYDKDIALKLIEKYQLRKKIKTVWKARGKIPDKYFSPNYQVPKPATKADLITQKRILEIFETDLLKNKTICDLAGVKIAKYFDIGRGKVTAFSAQEIRALKSVINKIEVKISKTFNQRSEKALRSLLKNPAITISIIVKAGGGVKYDVERLYQFRDGKIKIDAINYELTRDCFIKAAKQMSFKT